MTADLPNELIELLEKIVLQSSSEFADNRNLQNLLILTAIKADKTRVMDYINRLDNYDMPDIANIAVGSELYEEALVIFKKAELHREAAKVLIDYIASIERATEFAERIDEEEVWVDARQGAAASSRSSRRRCTSFIKANDATEYVAVIAAAEQAGANLELVDYLADVPQEGQGGAHRHLAHLRVRQERAVRLARGVHLGAQRGPHPGRGREVLTARPCTRPPRSSSPRSPTSRGSRRA